MNKLYLTEIPHRIDAIKFARCILGIGLKEAKNLIKQPLPIFIKEYDTETEAKSEVDRCKRTNRVVYKIQSPPKEKTQCEKLDLIEKIYHTAKATKLNFLIGDPDEKNLPEFASNELADGEYILFVTLPTEEIPQLNEYGKIVKTEYNLTMALMTISEYTELKGGGINPFQFGRYEKNVMPAKELWSEFYTEFLKCCKRKVTRLRITPAFDINDMNYDGIVIEMTMTDD